MKRLIYSIFIFLFISVSAFSQGTYLSHHMDWLPQSLNQNPALRPEFKGYFGFPAFSSFYTEYSHNLAFEDVFQRVDGDSLLLDVGYMIGNMQKHNFLELGVDEVIFDLGFSVRKDLFLRFSLTEKVRTRFAYPKEMISFLWQGNGAFLGETVDMSALGVELMSYSAFSAGASYPINDKIVAGINLKYLLGRGHASALATRFEIFTDPNTYDIQLESELEILTAGADVQIRDPFDVDYDFEIFGKDNQGFAIDLGATYQLDSSFRFSAGILDLGFIDWKTNARRHHIEDGNYTFSGLELDDLFGDNDAAFEDQLDELVDTLESIFDIQDEDKEYRRNLSSRLYLSGEYALSERHKLGLLMRADRFNERWYPSASLSYHHRFGKVLSLSANYTYRNYSFNNLGVGMSVKAGPFQFYLLNDNLPVLFMPDKLRFLNLQTGINFRFGEYGVKREKAPKAPKEEKVKKEKTRRSADSEDQ